VPLGNPSGAASAIIARPIDFAFVDGDGDATWAQCFRNWRFFSNKRPAAAVARE